MANRSLIVLIFALTLAAAAAAQTSATGEHGCPLLKYSSFGKPAQSGVLAGTPRVQFSLRGFSFRSMTSFE